MGHVVALDGMRAVAVVLVVLFHIRVPGFWAGYLGVDVFFVLSGFLITSLLIGEMQGSSRIALGAFWSRRARRLLPALAVLLLVVALVTWLIATFSERASLRGDLIASISYVANWRLIDTSSYFANTGLESPLQHTWSLAIEEQFYLVWPLLLAGVATVFARARAGVGMLAVAGIITSTIVMASVFSPDAVERAYMGTDARLFEPLVGALGAVLVATPRVRAWIERFARPMIALGLVGILAGLLTLRPGVAPYFYGGALAFSLATLLVVAPLWVGRAGWVERSLGWGPVAWIGVISYGIYLWHWPLIRWLGVRDATGTRRVLLGVAAVGLTVAVSAMSYYLVERPIRRRRLFGTHATRTWRLGRRVTAVAAALAVLLVVLSASLAATRVPPISSGTPVIMLVGDSVPLRIEPALERAAAEYGWRVVSAAHGGCSVSGEVPLSVDLQLTDDPKGCVTVWPEQRSLVSSSRADLVLWWDRFSLSSFETTDGVDVMSGSHRFWDLRRASLQSSVQRLGVDGARVVFVGIEPPSEGVADPCHSDRCRAWQQFRIDHYEDITGRWNAIMERFARLHPEKASFVSVTEVVCETDRAPCDDEIDGEPARPDGTHYEGAGEDLVVAYLIDQLRPLLGRAT